MKFNEKDLLLKDLCARLPYGVKVQCLSHQIPLKILSINPNGVTWVTGDKGYPFEVDCIEYIKPYLFPLSSMTEEQYNEIQTISGKDCMEHMEIEKEWRNNSPFTHLPLYQHRVIEFFHKYHFDYRGLIPMGLAIDATDLNIY